MKIEYKEIKDFPATALEDLFLSVEWSSGHFPDKLVVAMKNFKTVYSALIWLSSTTRIIYE